MKLAKMKITTDLIAKFDPCKSRFSNWKLHHNDFRGDVLDFLTLTAITPQDKVWVCCRVLPRGLIEVFAIDCAMRATAYYATDAANTAYAAKATTYAAYAAAANAEREAQVDALIYLIMNYGK